MTSLEIIKLHALYREFFGINKIPLAAIEAIRKSIYWNNADKFFEIIETNKKEIVGIIERKYNEDDNLKAYAATRITLDILMVIDK